jgi:hypothetical protein
MTHDIGSSSASQSLHRTTKLSSGGAPVSLKSQKPIVPRRRLQRLVRPHAAACVVRSVEQHQLVQTTI